MIRAVILDDETKGSSLLEHKLNSLDESLSVVRFFSNPELALAQIKGLEIDVLFLDVEMPKLNGFQFLEKLGSFDFEVIFVTAYNEYALDYLLKPVSPDELETAIWKLKTKLTQKALLQKNSHANTKYAASARLALPTAEGIYFVKKIDIIKVVA